MICHVRPSRRIEITGPSVLPVSSPPKITSSVSACDLVRLLDERKPKRARIEIASSKRIESKSFKERGHASLSQEGLLRFLLSLQPVQVQRRDVGGENPHPVKNQEIRGRDRKAPPCAVVLPTS